ncbi:mitochondrial ribosomal subunit protein-domain-containing protein [Tuber indicum]|nr:mitochondrial ribosomal subunit protein-domain-containing protein [Tuber indicum]
MASSLSRTIFHLPHLARRTMPTARPFARHLTSSPHPSYDQPILISQTPPPKPADRDPNEVEEKDWEGDDFTSSGHSELLRHREARSYARLAMYEMPLLSRLSKPFRPPSRAEVLRFRYTTYFGEAHPAESKVVVEFAPRDLVSLTAAQRGKLVKMVGARFDPERGVVKMSCEMFELQAQNKRYLSDLVDRLILEAKDESDDFGDIPFDFRHYTAKLKRPKARFPKAWIMNEKRMASIREERAAFAKLFERGGVTL